MRFFLCFAATLLLPFAAHAEKVKQPGWKDTNGMRAVSGNTFTTGPKVISVEEHNKKNAAVRKAWLSGEKPNVVKNTDGTTTIRRKLTQKQKRGIIDRMWSAITD